MEDTPEFKHGLSKKVEQLEQRVKELEAELKDIKSHWQPEEIKANLDLFDEMKQMIEYYASCDVWNCDYEKSIHAFCIIEKGDLGTGEFDFNEDTNDNRVGGKRARELLAKMKGSGV